MAADGFAGDGPNAALPLPSLNPADFATFDGDGIRERLLAAMRFDLLGPEGEQEILPQSPATRYLLGMLAPSGTAADPTENETIETADETSPEGTPPASFSLTPSSIGLSFLTDAANADLVVTASWGEYEKRERPGEVDPEEASDIGREEDADVTAKKKRKQYEWVRTPHREERSLGQLQEGPPSYQEVGEGVTLGTSVRRLGSKSVVSLFLVNSRSAPAGRRPPDEMWLYQPRLSVRGEAAPFLPRRVDRTQVDPDPDVASADVIYRKRLEFATGHGVAAAWDLADRPDRAVEVRTEVMPQHEVPIVRAREGAEGTSLSMDGLADISTGAEAVELLEPLLAEYGNWISEREEELGTIGPPDVDVAAEHVRLAHRSLERMRDGLRLLEEDESVLEAFKFANRAMAMQRRRSVAVLRKRSGQPAVGNVTATWRPFQIGFILQCIKGIAHHFDPDRSVADLLWFPTGGGKTEAYLGLTAFSIAHRRLRVEPDGLDTSGGTSVLMRYTLRLLTIQQFQRAAALLCACEVIRRGDPDKWGESPFSIGLWVGQSVTPGTYDDAKDALDKLKKEERVYEGNPYQILYCPWCGEDITPRHYVPVDEEERIRIKCWNEECDFFSARSKEGLPLLVVDQEIYRNPPSLLLATVDKFAQMAWNGRIQSLFGHVERWCPRHGYISGGEDHSGRHAETAGFQPAVVQDAGAWFAPPDLIIQDELHLISGPLGSLVGIYESAIDALCSRVIEGKFVSPKVIASTATVRGAHDQIEALFSRKTSVFPPLGLEASDSFFAHEDKEGPGRLYVGIFAPGKSIKTALVRAYAGLLSRAEVEFARAREGTQEAQAEADSYMTLVGYFNSLRELGGALRLVDDDVPARLRVLKKRGFGPARLIWEKVELTSRARTTQISDILKRMDRTFLTREKGFYPIDVLLASNMLSVGVDIGRLGLMVVSAQPKTSAEYIQATSRVGRVHPGLVVEVYNWVRPRDTSHYERFIHYHDTFYRHVEATSVTPFSARARDRALPAVLVSLMRQGGPRLAQEQAAKSFDASKSEVDVAIGSLAARAEDVSGRADVGDETRQKLKNLAGEWNELAAGDPPLRYSSRRLKKPEEWTVLLRPLELESGRGRWPAAGSLREVEPEVDVVLLDEDED